MVIAKENKLDIELVETNTHAGVSDDYKKIHKLGKIPAFVGKDGFVLTECIAIAVYCAYCSLLPISSYPIPFKDEQFHFIQLVIPGRIILLTKHTL